jgi:hypothetical protein
MVFHILFQNIEKEEKKKHSLTHSMSSVFITLIPKPKIIQENYRTVSLMNVNTKILNKILAE